MRITRFEKAKVGDKVWLLLDMKWHTIKQIDYNCEYPIKLDDDSTFTIQGSFFINSPQMLFWDEIEIIAPEKLPAELEVDTPVIVWNDRDGVEQKRYFSHFEKGRIACFVLGRTSWSVDYKGETNTWDNWELANIEE